MPPVVDTLLPDGMVVVSIEAGDVVSTFSPDALPEQLLQAFDKRAADTDSA